VGKAEAGFGGRPGAAWGGRARAHDGGGADTDAVPVYHGDMVDAALMARVLSLDVADREEMAAALNASLPQDDGYEPTQGVADIVRERAERWRRDPSGGLPLDQSRQEWRKLLP
jgi:hypothetical protein